MSRILLRLEFPQSVLIVLQLRGQSFRYANSPYHQDPAEFVLQDIHEGKYRVIITSPEQLMKFDGGFETLFKDLLF